MGVCGWVCSYFTSPSELDSLSSNIGAWTAPAACSNMLLKTSLFAGLKSADWVNCICLMGLY